jgi:radical SAM superfamily enzyme YgiQ (UPF0313 family)
MGRPAIAILNLPSPPGMDVYRDTAGAYGTAQYVLRKDYGHSSNVFLPTFIPYLATSLLRNGYQIKVLDGQVERLTLASFVGWVERENPAVVIAMPSLPSIWGDCDALARIKRTLPKTKLIGIGPVSAPFAHEILRKSGVDLLVRGEYPFYHTPILMFLKHLEEDSLRPNQEIPGAIFSYKSKSKFEIVDVPSPGTHTDGSLNELDLEVYHRLPISKYKIEAMGLRGKRTNYFPILGGKGCPYGCTYCPYPLGYGTRLVLKSPPKVVEEMHFLRENFGVKAFIFRDQLFTASSRRVNSLCDLIMERGLDVSWLVEARIDEVSQPMLCKMRQAGCVRIQYGVETGDAALLAKVGKPGLVIETIREGFENTVREGIFAVAFILLGLPEENRAAIRKTFELVMRLDCDNILCSVVTPYPGTELFDLAREKQLILTYDWRRYTSRHIVMRTDELSGNELARIRAMFMMSFRAKQLFRMLRSARSRGDGTLSWRGAFYRLRMAWEHAYGRRI